MLKKLTATAYIIVLFFLFGPNCYALDKVLVTYVSDGDTLHVSVAGRDHRLRLIGIDTPESSVNDRSVKQAHHSDRKMDKIISLGERAKQYVKTLVHKGDVVSIEYDVEREDKYKRILAYVFLHNGTMLNEKIIRDGYAKPLTVPPNVRYVKKFLKAFDLARKEHAGLWSN